MAFATHAAISLLVVRQSAGLGTAVETRHIIGVAQGILMSRYDISMEGAFQLLRRYSNASHTKLRDVAQLVVETRDLPTLGRAARSTPSRSAGSRPDEASPSHLPGQRGV